MSSRSGTNSTGFKGLFISQALGALNDNLFKVTIILMASALFAGERATIYIALAGALFNLPYILFSPYAGDLADRFSKRSVIILTKALEIFTMTLGLLGFVYGEIEFLLACLFLMGLQSTLFSPAKYGIVPELIRDGEVTRANGLLEFGLFCAIIMGSASAGPLLDLFGGEAAYSSLLMIAVAVAGTLAALFVDRVPASGYKEPFKINPFPETISTLRAIFSNRSMGLAVIGSVAFFFFGALFQLNIIQYAKELMNLSDGKTGILLAVSAVGIGTGSLLAGRFSRGRIEYGLVPLGAIGAGVSACALALSYPSTTMTLLLLFTMGMSCGLFYVPLMAHIQQKSPADQKGRVLAAVNLLTSVGIFAASGVLLLLRSVLGFSPAGVFLTLGVLTLLGTVYVWILLPEYLVRFCLLILANTLYRIRSVGAENLSKEGGALLVANHISFADPLLIAAASTRPVYFVAHRFYCEKWSLRFIFKLMGAIPISSEDSPKMIARALNGAVERVKAGDLVCIFAEGSLSRTGNMYPFRKGFERIARRSGAPIHPVHIDRIWGSVFSFERGKFYWKVPRSLPYPVTVNFGKGMPNISTAFAVQSAVAELGAESFPLRYKESENLLSRFIRTAKENPLRFCVADSTGVRMNFFRALIASLALSRSIQRGLRSKSEHVGLMIPPSAGAALTTAALMMIGRVGVHLNFTVGKENWEHAVKECGIERIIVSRTLLKRMNIPVDDRMLFIEDLVMGVQPMDKCFGFVSALLPAAILSRLISKRAGLTKDSTATVIFSSGSTGHPKGVVLTHQNILSNVDGFYDIFHARKKDVLMGTLPFFHSFGYTATCWFPLVKGVGVAYHSNPLEAKRVGEMIEEHRATALITTPTFLLGYIRRCAAEQMKSLRLVFTGAEKLNPKIAGAFEEKFGILPMEGYGCTELAPIVSVSVPDYEGPAIDGTWIHQKGNKPGSVGQPIPGVAVRVVDPETRALLGPNEEGLLEAKGPNVMKWYLNDEEGTAAVIKDGWYSTGDIAVMDEDLFIFIRDRLSRFAKIGGEMVPLVKIEEALQEASKSLERAFAVASIPDEKRGEALVVLYTGERGIERLVKNLEEAGLPPLWIPDRGMFFGVDSLPMLGSGKLDLKRIKQIGTALAFAREDSSRFPLDESLIRTA